VTKIVTTKHGTKQCDKKRQQGNPHHKRARSIAMKRLRSGDEKRHMKLIRDKTRGKSGGRRYFWEEMMPAKKAYKKVRINI